MTRHRVERQLVCPSCGGPMNRRAKHCSACAHKLYKPIHKWPAPLERFWANVQKSPDPDGCWLWTGSTNSSGYGCFYVDGHLVATHRFSYELHTGTPIPEGLGVLHRCDNPLCCNPAHLFLGTHTDNMKDAVDKHRFPSGDASNFSRFPELRHNFPRGEANKNAKLTWDKVREIRRRNSNGESAYSLAPLYGVSKQSILAILHNRTWKESCADTQ